MPRSPSGHDVVQRVVVRGQVDPQQVQDVRGDVVVERRGGVGHHQRHPAGDGAEQHEELVVHVEQSEHGARGAQAAQLGDGGVEVDQRVGVHAGAAPAPVFPDRGDGDSPGGRRPAPPAAPSRSARPCPYGRPPQGCAQSHRRMSLVHRIGRGCQDRRMRSADPLLAGLGEQARRLQPRTVALRRALHRHPELGLEPARGRATPSSPSWPTSRCRCTTAARRRRSSRVLEGARPGLDGAAARPTWTRSRCRRTRACRSAPRSTARCTPAGTTRTSRCSPPPPGCSPPDASSSRGGCC